MLKLKNKGRLVVLILCFALLFFLPLVIDWWLSAKDSHYKQLSRTYECINEICEADFDGDGTPGRLVKDRTSPSVSSEYQIIVVDSNRELLHLPYWDLDTTSRTHVALTNELGQTRLLYFDHRNTRGQPVNAVYTWNGDEMALVASSDNDKEILAAMAALDLTGTLNDWIDYRMFRLPVMALYYLIFIGSIALKIHRTRSPFN